MPRSNNNLILLIIGAIFTCILIACCALIVIFYNPSPPQPTPTSLDVQSIIALTANAALASTQSAYPPTANATNTSPASSTPPPANTPTFDLIGTLAANPTSTQSVILPVITSSSSQVCSCSGDQYNCPDFNSQTQAQSCFDYCRSQGYDDPSQLDRDDDLLACENTNY